MLHRMSTSPGSHLKLAQLVFVNGSNLHVHFRIQIHKSCTSRVEKGDLSCPIVPVVLHTIHLSSSSAGSGETHLQALLHSLFWHDGGDVGNLELFSGHIEVDLRHKR
ncbi:hypothetical protein EYF80_033437 [Liparis tanakae]|uniref:Uncharacterized protein n=1 Tax=Liparis tanakae TaxID=230148 RepID=A0A4Z2GS74_9TELE|nr:hypothetical protein EYF80_033437 [Liparis tanakae]